MSEQKQDRAKKLITWKDVILLLIIATLAPINIY